MAEYEDNLAEIQQRPVPEFYVFTSGSTIERYTSYSRDLTFLGRTFSAATIQRGTIKVDTKLNIIKLTVATPMTPNMTKYIANTPVEPIGVTIYRSHIDYLDQYSVFFSGKVVSVQFKGKIASAECESKNSILSAKIPQILYQSFCNHDIYDSGCQVSESNYKRVATVTGFSGDGATISFSFTDGGGSVSDDYFKTGKIVFGTDERLVTAGPGGSLAADEVQIHIPFSGDLIVGSTINIYPGCDGSPSTCLNTYNNLIHFLGMPYIPSSNPVIWGFK